MSFEDEKIEQELNQLTHNEFIMSNSEYSNFLLNPKFKDQFLFIPESVCPECGQIYRLTHHCDSSEQDVWIFGWKKLFRSLFESYKKQEKLIEETHKQGETLQKLQEESRLKIQLAKQQLENEKLKKELELIKQNTNSTSTGTTYSKEQYRTSSYRGKKLTLDSITHLNQIERNAYEELRRWRNSQAKIEHKKPYIIAHNTMLMAIVYYRVSSEKELTHISGFSERKAESYGPAILNIMKRNNMATGIVKSQAKKLYVQPKKSQVITNANKKSNKKRDVVKIFIVLVAAAIIVGIILIVG